MQVGRGYSGYYHKGRNAAILRHFELSTASTHLSINLASQLAGLVETGHKIHKLSRWGRRR